MEIPKNEIDFLVNTITSNPEYLNPLFIHNFHKNYTHSQFPDPFSDEVPKLIITAIKSSQPFSVIRIGDGEANLLSYNSHPETPILNFTAANKIISMQQDKFTPTPNNLSNIKSLLHYSIFNADIIGIIGLWRPQKRNTADLVSAFYKDQRGISGHWRAIQHLLDMSYSGYLKNKVLASAHLYFSILDNLQEILDSAKKVLIITNISAVNEKLEDNYSTKVEHISVGHPLSSKRSAKPIFLNAIKSQLPSNMSNYLCLIGAGPWSEIYCTWVKQRGGVAIDIGTGFDLLDGKITRPIHKILNLETHNRYKL